MMPVLLANSKTLTKDNKQRKTSSHLDGCHSTKNQQCLKIILNWDPRHHSTESKWAKRRIRRQDKGNQIMLVHRWTLDSARSVDHNSRVPQHSPAHFVFTVGSGKLGWSSGDAREFPQNLNCHRRVSTMVLSLMDIEYRSQWYLRSKSIRLVSAPKIDLEHPAFQSEDPQCGWRLRGYSTWTLIWSPRAGKPT